MAGARLVAAGHGTGARSARGGTTSAPPPASALACGRRGDTADADTLVRKSYETLRWTHGKDVPSCRSGAARRCRATAASRFGQVPRRDRGQRPRPGRWLGRTAGAGADRVRTGRNVLDDDDDDGAGRVVAPHQLRTRCSHLGLTAGTEGATFPSNNIKHDMCRPRATCGAPHRRVLAPGERG